MFIYLLRAHLFTMIIKLKNVKEVMFLFIDAEMLKYLYYNQIDGVVEYLNILLTQEK